MVLIQVLPEVYWNPALPGVTLAKLTGWTRAKIIMCCVILQENVVTVP